MRKLKLDPERLKVESFDLPAAHEARGTVRARGDRGTTRTNEQSCGFTCSDSYNADCDATLCDPGCL